MDMTVCPKCKMRVFPKADGTCPSCGAMLKSAAKTRSASKVKREAPLKNKNTVHQVTPIEAASRRRAYKISVPSPQSHPVKRIGKLHYGEVFLKSTKIVWEHKILWIPTILMSAITLFYANFSTIRNLSEDLSENTSPLSGVLTSLICITGIIFIVAEFVLGYGGIIFVIRGVFEADQGKKTLSFKDLIQSAKKHFWGTIGLSFLLGLVIMAVMLPILVIALLVDEPLMSNPEALLSNSWAIYLFAFLTAAITSGLTQISLNALILEDREAPNALSRGGRLFFRFLGPNLLIGLIMVALVYGTAYLLALPQNLLFPKIQSILTGGESDVVSILLYSAIGIIYWLVYSVLLGIVQAFYQSTWTLVFRRSARILDLSVPAPVENA